VAQPADRGILLSSVLEHGSVDREKSLCLTRRYSEAYGTQAYMCRRYLGKSMGQMVFEGDMEALKNLFKRNDHFSDMDGELTGCRIRQLTPLEAERLQTLPDNYTASEPNRKKRLEAIGNGWTVEVIAHLLSGLAEK
jgi:DNA (cytosine-5)-methyltransferase 3A